MNDKPIQGGISMIPYLLTGKTDEERAIFKTIRDACRPHTKGLREMQTVAYYDIESDYHFDELRNRSNNINQERLAELSDMVNDLMITHNIAIGNYV
jgi:hypothetical protein